jgi:hypothetical protein
MPTGTMTHFNEYIREDGKEIPQKAKGHGCEEWAELL